MTTRIVYMLFAIALLVMAVVWIFAHGPAVPRGLLAAICAIVGAMFAHDGLMTDRKERFIS